MSCPTADRFDAGDGVLVSYAFSEPVHPRAVVVFAHGAGAGMDHANMVAISDAFTAVGGVVMRFNFPYMEAGRRRVDRQAVSTRAVAAAIAVASAAHPDLPLLAGGHSYGGRMASHAVLDEGLGEVCALVFGSFPLHQPKKPSIDRAAHLKELGVPMLFLSGTRDALAEPALLGPLVESLPGARLHWLDTADHGYKILKRTRQSALTVFEEMGQALSVFLDDTIA